MGMSELQGLIMEEVVSEPDSDNPNDYVGLTDIECKAAKELVKKKRRAIQRRARNQRAKY